MVSPASLAYLRTVLITLFLGVFAIQMDAIPPIKARVRYCIAMVDPLFCNSFLGGEKAHLRVKNCWVVGDRVCSDVLPAKEAGLIAIHVTAANWAWPYTNGEKAQTMS